jgi:hypothetical protein
MHAWSIKKCCHKEKNTKTALWFAQQWELCSRLHIGIRRSQCKVGQFTRLGLLAQRV